MLFRIFNRNRRNTGTAFNRRDLFRQGGLLTIAGSLPAYAGTTHAGSPEAAGELYRSIGVRPVINAQARSPSSPARRPCPK